MARKKHRDGEAGGFGESTTSTDRQRLTPVEIQQKVFRLAFRGYNERDVDQFLDHVTEDLAALHEENKRLREQGGSGSSGAEVAAAQQEAEAIVRQAREHAARLVEDAESRGGGSGGGLPSSFLLREREFLQGLAASVQGHASWLKEEAARRANEAASERAPKNAVEAPRPAPKASAPKASSQKASAAKKTATKVPDAEKQARAAAAAAGSAGLASAGLADEPTASWVPPQEGGTGWSQPSTEEPDPLLSAWESAFTEGSEPATGAPEEGGDPSLRELFWGEE